MKIIKKVLLILLVVLVIIQFFRPQKNISNAAQPGAISLQYAVPSNVKSILGTACNDCHSNNTRYPWYAHIQPVAWWLDGHIQDGKHDLNFDEFTTYRLRKQYKRMEDVEELVNDGSMPLTSYTLVHTDAKLSPADREALVKWSQTVRDTMRSRFPIDSLIRKK